MAGPTLGTLLIQRLDAALGTTLSQQTQIVNRATSDPVTHPGQATRPEPVSNTLVRDTRENVDRAMLNSRPGARVDTPPGSAETAAAGRSAGHSVTTSATTSLGLAARIILDLFASHASRTPPVTARTPLLSTAPQAAAVSAASSRPIPTGTTQTTQSAAAISTAQGSGGTSVLAQSLVRALAQNLQQSGLFYESHLKSIVSGQYRVADIRQEPQAQIPSSSRSDPAAPPTSTPPGPSTQAPSQAHLTGGAADTGAGTTASGTTTGGSASGTAQATQGTSVQGTSVQGTQHGSPATPGIDPATHGIVRQQLEALADQSIHWRGEAWPGAQMDWHIKRHPDHEQSSDSNIEPDNASWQSQIKIQLPQLGDITMGVRLAGKQVYVTLQADEDTAPLLQRHTGELHDQMSARQLELTAITFIEPEATPS